MHMLTNIMGYLEVYERECAARAAAPDTAAADTVAQHFRGATTDLYPDGQLSTYLSHHVDLVQQLSGACCSQFDNLLGCKPHSSGHEMLINLSPCRGYACHSRPSCTTTAFDIRQHLNVLQHILTPFEMRPHLRSGHTGVVPQRVIAQTIAPLEGRAAALPVTVSAKLLSSNMSRTFNVALHALLELHDRLIPAATGNILAGKGAPGSGATKPPQQARSDFALRSALQFMFERH